MGLRGALRKNGSDVIENISKPQGSRSAPFSYSLSVVLSHCISNIGIHVGVCMTLTTQVSDPTLATCSQPVATF